MKIDRGKILFGVAALLLAGLFARLGFWQLDRHRERGEANRERRERMAMPALAVRSAAGLAELPPPESLEWRRILVRGRWDFGNEMLLRPRSHGGRPAVELLTPLLLGRDTAVLVVRGWLPSPDALHAPIRSARPAGDTATVRGVVLAPRAPAGGADARPTPDRVTVDGEEHVALRRVSLESATDQLTYNIAQFYVQQIHDGPTGSRIRALPTPDPRSGPHLSYALQWFAFALIALVGTGVLLSGDR